MIHSEKVALVLSEHLLRMYDENSMDEEWCMERSEALLKYKRARKPSLWLLAWGEHTCELDPYTVYTICKRESDYMESKMDVCSGRHLVTPTPLPTPTWSASEQARIDKALVILSVPRAVYMAAMELDRTSTPASIQRKWLLPRDIQEARERHMPFLTKMMVRERVKEGFIGKHIVLAKDLHLRRVRELLTRTTAVIALSERAIIVKEGEYIWEGSYAEAYDALMSAKGSTRTSL